MSYLLNLLSIHQTYDHSALFFLIFHQCLYLAIVPINALQYV
nr:MAG TPA: hypothetical protein [Crassvirales sp.]